MNTPHKWAKEIHAFADGAVIEFAHGNGEWSIVSDPVWSAPYSRFRVKPVPVVHWLVVTHTGAVYAHTDTITGAREWHAKQVERRIMRLEIDPTTFTATCVLEDV